MYLSWLNVARVSQDPRHTRVWLGLLLTLTLVSGCGQREGAADSGSIAGPVPAIHLTVPSGSGSSSIEVQGLDSGTLAALDGLKLNRGQWEQVLRTAVQQDTLEADAGIPPVLGSYSIEEGLVRFTPMFPLDPGRAYVVTFDPSRYVDVKTRLPVVSVVALPARTTTPTARVARVYPTASVFPENQLKVYIYFSEPMRASNGLPYVKLLDETGNEVRSAFLPLGDVLGTGLWDPARQRYTVFFDPGRIKQGLVLSDELGRFCGRGRNVYAPGRQRLARREG